MGNRLWDERRRCGSGFVGDKMKQRYLQVIRPVNYTYFSILYTENTDRRK